MFTPDLAYCLFCHDSKSIFKGRKKAGLKKELANKRYKVQFRIIKKDNYKFNLWLSIPKITRVNKP